MRLAFVGKGGSGKTTVSALFSLYMDSKNKRVGLLDVDVNSHTAAVLGLESMVDIELSNELIASDIRRYLAGTNDRVSRDEFLNSTPPGTGSGVFTLDADNYVINNYSRQYGKSARLFTVGSYKEAAIGIDCHHSTQYVAENLLSHAKLDDSDMLVIDAVAGNDIFGNSLYLQDALVFIVKPEREGIDVFRRFVDLAGKAGMSERVFAIGNQVISDRQEQFLRTEIEQDKLLGILPLNEELIDARLDGTSLSLDLLQAHETVVFDMIYEAIRKHQRPASYYYDEIVALHRRLAGEGWVIGSYRKGMENQVDPDYQIHQ